MATLHLRFHLHFPDLYDPKGLAHLDQVFLAWLRDAAEDLATALNMARTAPQNLPAKEHSALLVDLAPFLQDFLAQLFGIEKEAQALAEKHHHLAPLYTCKRQFVQRRAFKKYTTS